MRRLFDTLRTKKEEIVTSSLPEIKPMSIYNNYCWRPKMVNCVVRTYNTMHPEPTTDLINKLNDGWLVKSSITFHKSGDIELVEYILEKEVNDYEK